MKIKDTKYISIRLCLYLTHSIARNREVHKMQNFIVLLHSVREKELNIYLHGKAIFIYYEHGHRSSAQNLHDIYISYL